MLWAEAGHVRLRLGSFAGSNIMKTCVYLEMLAGIRRHDLGGWKYSNTLCSQYDVLHLGLLIEPVVKGLFITESAGSPVSGMDQYLRGLSWFIQSNPRSQS